MFWHKKEAAKALPDLPPMKFMPPAQSPASSPSQPSLYQDEAETEYTSPEKHALPSFPDSPLQKGFAQTAIKDAVATPDTVEEHEADEETALVAQPLAPGSSIKTVEVDEWSPSSSPPALELPAPPLRQATRKREMPLPLPPSPPMSFPSFPMSPQRSQKNSDIFIRIERFASAKRALEAANQKLDEIDSLLHKIRETKMREEQELASWEKDLATIKARIKEVTETIFEKGDEP